MLVKDVHPTVRGTLFCDKDMNIVQGTYLVKSLLIKFAAVAEKINFGGTFDHGFPELRFLHRRIDETGRGDGAAGKEDLLSTVLLDTLTCLFSGNGHGLGAYFTAATKQTVVKLCAEHVDG